MEFDHKQLEHYRSIYSGLGEKFVNSSKWYEPSVSTDQSQDSNNELAGFAANNDSGPGIWKWQHYFEVYEHHFRKFVGRPVNILEIGVYSGGSLAMWQHYFGPGVQVFGVDIEESCKSYARPGVQIFTGDQADRGFWRRLLPQLPKLDIVIDDGGHQVHQQIASMEEILPQMSPGAVYLVEDIHHTENQFAHYVNGMSRSLHDFRGAAEDTEDANRRLTCEPTKFQSVVASVHTYPFVSVIEKRSAPITEFVAPKRGTRWEPFLEETLTKEREAFKGDH